MLLTIDVGNTETKLGCFAETGELRYTWRVTTELRRTADEYGVFFTQLFATSSLAPDAIDAIAVASVVPETRSRAGIVVRALLRREALLLACGSANAHGDSHADALRSRRGSRRRGDRRTRTLRRAAHRREFRHRDGLCGRLRGWRIPGRRDRAGHRDLGGRADRENRQAAPDRAGGARARDRPQHERRAAQRHRLRIHRVKPRRSSPGYAPRWASRRRWSLPAVSPRSWPGRRRSSMR